MKSNYILLKSILLSTFIVSCFAFLGPYDYQFESLWAIGYYYLCIIFLIVPLLFCGKKNKEITERNRKRLINELSSAGEKFLLLAITVSIVASCCFAVECIRLFSLDAILTGGDFREEFGDFRSNFSKYAEILSCLGPASYLISVKLDIVHNKLIKPLALVSLVLMGLTGLLLGARWKMFLCVLILILSEVYKNRTDLKLAKNVKQLLRYMVIVIIVVLIVYAFMTLFSVRGLLAADEQYRFYYGDMPLKPWALNLFELSNGAVQPIYRAMDYIGQSPFVFSYIFIHEIPSQLYYGAFFARVLGYLLPLLGIPFPNNAEIAQETFTGMYSGSAYGFIVDFGVWLAPVAFFIVGLCFSAIERRIQYSRWCSMVFPLTQSVLICSPIYYLFHVGYADYIFLWFVLMFGFMSIAGMWKAKALT